MAIRSTGIRPIERNGLKGFGLTISIDNTNSHGLSVRADAGGGCSSPAATPGDAALLLPGGVTGPLSTRPAPFDGSGDEPSVPSFAAGGAKMRDDTRAGRGDERAEAKQVAINSESHGQRPEVDA
ncbi:hypothetical protein [Aquamicrobium zhengzhouense]|uniref:Uncharacterized protein n=1 Tax=Aquamicrobium zhengzhouense TaxID=2781738 RepID=A0ABS0SAQ3_9HYPH|nr:hypothetical protein [Aquamicrobium zhengzhouense]MBI1620332.1 hypothetical protein [Aquamicrobium zhengzhouense]